MVTLSIWLESELEWNGSIPNFRDEMILYYMFGYVDGMAPFVVWLEVREWSCHYTNKHRYVLYVGPACR